MEIERMNAKGAKNGEMKKKDFLERRRPNRIEGQLERTTNFLLMNIEDWNSLNFLKEITSEYKILLIKILFKKNFPEKLRKPIV